MITKSQLDEMLKNKHVTVEETCTQIGKGRRMITATECMINDGSILSFTVPGNPVSCPRMTQRDKWMKRPCVMRYREYSDRLRKFVNLHDLYVGKVTAKFHMPMPESWSVKKILAMAGQPHRQRGDVDNMVKAILDSLMKEDGMVWSVYAEKFWAQPGKERTELTFEA